MARRYVVVFGLLLGIGCSDDLLRYRTKMWHQCQARYGQALERQKHLKVKLAAEERARRGLESKNAACRNTLRSEQQRVAQLERELARREALSRKLEEETKKMAERAAFMRRLLGRLRSMVEAGNLQVRIRKGRMILNLPNQILFPPGKAKLRPQGKEALRRLAEILRDIKGRDLVVAGHTDNVPIRHSRFKSNWELSVARALAVVEFLQDQGVDPHRLSAAGYSMYDPVADNTTAEGRALNRRIEIIVMPKIEELPEWGELPGVEGAGQEVTAGPAGSGHRRLPVGGRNRGVGVGAAPVGSGESGGSPGAGGKGSGTGRAAPSTGEKGAPAGHRDEKRTF